MEPFRTEDKIFFKAGELVKVKHALTNVPVMLIKSKEQKLIKQDDASHFVGMRCIWFSTDNKLQEYVFSTKDLEHYYAQSAH